MICYSLKTRTYHVLCKFLKGCSAIHWVSRLTYVGWGGAKGNREHKRKRKKKEARKTEQKKTGWWNDAAPDHVLNQRGWAWRTTKESLLSQDMGSLFIRDFIFNTKTLLVQTKWCGFKQNESTLQWSRYVKVLCWHFQSKYLKI